MVDHILSVLKSARDSQICSLRKNKFTLSFIKHLIPNKQF